MGIRSHRDASPNSLMRLSSIPVRWMKFPVLQSTEFACNFVWKARSISIHRADSMRRIRYIIAFRHLAADLAHQLCILLRSCRGRDGQYRILTQSRDYFVVRFPHNPKWIAPLLNIANALTNEPAHHRNPTV